MSQETEVVRKINELKQQVNTKTQQDAAFQQEASRLLGSCSSLVDRTRTGITALLEKAGRVASLEASVRALTQRVSSQGNTQSGDLQSLQELEQSVQQLAGSLRTQDITGPLGELNTKLQDLGDRIGNATNSGSNRGGRKKKGGYSYTRKSFSRTRSKSNKRRRRRRRTKSKKR